MSIELLVKPIHRRIVGGSGNVDRGLPRTCTALRRELDNVVVAACKLRTDIDVQEMHTIWLATPKHSLFGAPHAPSDRPVALYVRRIISEIYDLFDA
jgi:hypothetical protein